MKKFNIYFSVITVLLFAGTVIHAQQPTGDRVNVSFSDPSKPGLVVAYVNAGSITIKGYSGKEVVIQAKLRDKPTQTTEGGEIPDKAKGMKRITANLTGLIVEEEENEMKIYVSHHDNEVDLDIQVPFQTSLKVASHEGGPVLVEKVTGEIEATCSEGDLTLKNISGSVVANAYDGELVVSFDQIDQGKPMSFSAYAGDIDVTFPSTVKATVMIKTNEGDIYSDFEIALRATPKQQVKDERKAGGKYRISFGEYVTGAINGGGPEFQFVSYDGNVYLRKK
ncbi:MAG: DUF4097 family beta strand repeat protein [Candidatus Aminicenantes bacterium]|nr:MAG: DUF4097 family beta strand repeat protein [Candidatus Aminicenantes bacterium]